MPGLTEPKAIYPMAAIHALVIYFDRIRPLLVLLAVWGWLRQRNY